MTKTNTEFRPAWKDWPDATWLAEAAGVGEQCARRWIRQHGLGRKVAGRYKVDPIRGRQFLEGIDYTAKARTEAA